MEDWREEAKKLPDPTPMDGDAVGDFGPGFMGKPLGIALIFTGLAGLCTAVTYLFTPLDFNVFWWSQGAAIVMSWRFSGNSSLQRFVGAVFALIFAVIQLIFFVTIYTGAVVL